ncbi:MULTISPECIES: L,D-transpeptidase family protein [Chitinophaga]|nr:L,D-transpeptidase family protein [Chitinophaga ginsengisegetis]MDR6568424.1 murein L,D-transpeptidase YafK [Chitinophaga ginsengisegetis]MDR6648345.1 murein L,D-transpeptidase YafK [Chitinophaga ginsengisegetis]MDR6654505.1 murein L,D-transpeptidase YafK [Chitinophaga ginsengisegetis]
MKRLVVIVLILLGAGKIFAQQSFLDNQKMFPKVGEAYREKEELLKKEFEKKGLVYPARYMFVRSFKLDSEMEIWVKNNPQDTFRLFKSYRVCTLSGKMGPKRKEGDRQVPEGFYYINDFNPNSNYHLSLGINYPNFSDRILSDPKNPGGEIYIHGNCITVGCIPLTDEFIDEVYILAVNAKNAGQDFIPVHVFPVKFGNPGSMNYLGTFTMTDNSSKQFWAELRSAYDYFEKHHRLPVVLVDDKGKYIL